MVAKQLTLAVWDFYGMSILTVLGAVAEPEQEYTPSTNGMGLSPLKCRERTPTPSPFKFWELEQMVNQWQAEKITAWSYVD